MTAGAHISAHPPRLGYLFGAYSIFYVGASYMTNELILTDGLLEKEWNASFDEHRVASMLDQRRKWALLGYGLIPAALLAKMLFSSLCLATGCAVADWSFRFRDLFRVVVHAEIVFAIAAIVHLGWILFGKEFSAISDFTSFYPLSALHLVEIEPSQLWLAYPLKTLNAFEIGYIAVLTWGVREAFQKPVGKATALVLCSYGTGLLLLVSAITFLALYLL